MNVLETRALGKRYRRTWALADCTIAIPEGHLAALVGPNGAGKTTLLNIAVGLTTPTTGEVSVLGGVPAGSAAALDGIAYVAQEMPLYRQMSVADMLHLAHNLNRGFDTGYARSRLADLAIPTDRKTGTLSGGQRAQLALTLALARHPRLLVLDEPTAPLDPVARHDFMATVMAAMTDDGLSVVLSSHVLAELERVADYLLLITGGKVRLAGTVETLTTRHRLVTGPAGERAPAGWQVIESSTAGAQQHLLVTAPSAAQPPPDPWQSRPVGIEEIAMGYLRETPQSKNPALVGSAR
jgi:ABC-2 type transport system ATP-binding protein